MQCSSQPGHPEKIFTVIDDRHMRKPSCLVFSDAAHIISEQVHLESIGSLKMKVSVVLQCVFLVGFLSTLEGRARGRARAATSKWRDCSE